jgi:hypothetical protein
MSCTGGRGVALLAVSWQKADSNYRGASETSLPVIASILHWVAYDLLCCHPNSLHHLASLSPVHWKLQSNVYLSTCLHIYQQKHLCWKNNSIAIILLKNIFACIVVWSATMSVRDMKVSSTSVHDECHNDDNHTAWKGPWLGLLRFHLHTCSLWL